MSETTTSRLLRAQCFSRHLLPWLVLIPALLAGCTDTADSAATLQPSGESAAGAGSESSTSATAEAATYIGSTACADCHAREHAAWSGSHHDLALQISTPETVLAPFDDEFNGVHFIQDADGYTIRPAVDEPPLPVRFTFGVEPLQQYVVEAADGRLQTFPTPWDSRPESTGGQRWYELYPGASPPGDPMHWNGRANSWNAQCADCHSTAVQKNYDPEARAYSTSFEVEDVGCEACHGAGSLHAATPQAYPLSGLDRQDEQINVCAPCHSRRSQLAEGFTPATDFFDHYAPSLLRAGLYHVDGQILDEVYEYGSFLQSPMHRAGVQCSHCHEPHSGKLRFPGNAVCTQCHQSSGNEQFQTLTKKIYDDPSHHFHETDSAGARCVSCHMPAVTYMGVDERRDHSFRRPRPDLAGTLGVPDVCTGCHEDRSPGWAAAEISARFGPTRASHFAETFAAAQRGESQAGGELAALVADTTQPIMVRASALGLLGRYSRGYVIDAISLSRSTEPLLRFAAPQAAASLSPRTRWRLISPLLDDELRAVRYQAFNNLLPIAGADPAYAARLRAYLPTFLSEQAFNRDFPETLTNIAAAEVALGDAAAAEATLNEALALQPSWVPGWLNLADLYRASGREAQAGGAYQAALKIAPDSPEASFGYGLWLTRQGRSADSVDYLARAAALAPDTPTYGYAHALALSAAGNPEGTIEQLEALLVRFPENEEILFAAATTLRDQGRFQQALVHLDRLLQLRPDDEQLRRFRQQLAQQPTR
ncbi:MAG: tetratricopeptide repeat protein [Pseudomonadales bacterium]|nr:tetratricopeptide repeat protein [Pseudomonadales bacterium]